MKYNRILPFEHASESKHIYDNALVLSALGKLDYKAYPEAVGLLLQVKGWPENPGVGKPYEVPARKITFLPGPAGNLGTQGGRGHCIWKS